MFFHAKLYLFQVALPFRVSPKTRKIPHQSNPTEQIFTLLFKVTLSLTNNDIHVIILIILFLGTQSPILLKMLAFAGTLSLSRFEFHKV